MQRFTIILGALLLASLVSTGALAAPGDIFYVDKDNRSGTQDGQGWATAYATIQDGIEAARRAAGGEVWVAAGIYDEARPNGGSLLLRATVELYGGFRGVETDREARDPDRNVTVVDGSAADAGSPTSPVVSGANNAVLDGFTIRGGRGGSGAGLFCNQVSPIIRNCVFTDNDADEFGGAVLNNEGAAPIFSNCIFTDNSAGISGGAVANNASSPEFNGCTFSLNTSTDAGGAMLSTPGSDINVFACLFSGNSSGQGGGVFNDNNSPLFEACIFTGNNTLGFGGAIFNNEASPLLVNVMMTNNQASEWGGAMANLLSSVSIINCTFTENRSDDTGGALFNNASSVIVLNSIFWQNTPNEFFSVDGTPQVRNTLIQGGFAGQGNFSADPQFRNAVAGDYSLGPNSPAINAASASGAPAEDIDGTLRPQGDGIDMGAYEATEIGTPVDPPDPVAGCGSSGGAQGRSGDLLLIACVSFILLMTAARRAHH
jgi:hypothetical protein